MGTYDRCLNVTLRTRKALLLPECKLQGIGSVHHRLWLLACLLVASPSRQLSYLTLLSPARPQPDELNLLEDGLQLWLVTLRNAPSPHPGLLSLFPNLVAAMERSTEHIAVGMKVAASCVLLGKLRGVYLLMDWLVGARFAGGVDF